MMLNNKKKEKFVNSMEAAEERISKAKLCKSVEITKKKFHYFPLSP